MHRIGTSEFKATCLRVLREVSQSGQPVTVTRDNNPIAVIYPPPAKKARKAIFGCMKKVTILKDDLIAPLDLDWDQD